MITAAAAKCVIFASIFYLALGGQAFAKPLPQTEDNQSVYNFNAGSMHPAYGSFMALLLNVQSTPPNTQISYNLYTEIDGVGLERSGQLVGTTSIIFSNIQASVDGKFSVGLYAPTGSVDISGAIARISATSGQVVFLDGIVSSVPESSKSLYLLIGMVATLAASCRRKDCARRRMGF